MSNTSERNKMAWVQSKTFILARMGHVKNMCLHNVRLGYGIAPKYADARRAMYENRDKGTLHPLSTIPTNVTVPVFTDRGTWGHVEVCLNGTYYSDGQKVGKPNSTYQWGEYLNGVRVVKKSTNPQPTIKVGDSVIVTGQGTATSKGTGAKTKNYNGRKMKVISIGNGHYGCNQYNKAGAITGWWTASQVKKA